MSRTARAAKSARDNFCADTLLKLAEACRKDAGDAKVGPALSPLALAEFFGRIGDELSDRPSPTAKVNNLAARLKPLLDTLARKGIQDSDRFAHEVLAG